MAKQKKRRKQSPKNKEQKLSTKELIELLLEAIVAISALITAIKS